MKRALALAALGLIIMVLLLRNVHRGLPVFARGRQIQAGAGGQSRDIHMNPQSIALQDAQNTNSEHASRRHLNISPKAALEEMTTTLCEYTKPDHKLNDLVEHLKTSHQDPFLARDSNPYSGEMTIVRTNSPLPSTRYFHAQFFSDEKGRTFAQHVSFELKPGPNSMNEARESVEQFCPRLGKSTYKRDGFEQWSLDSGYVLWIKQLTAEDLKNNPFNGYVAADVGSIRIAVELNPHDEN